MRMRTRFGLFWASAATLVLAASCTDFSHRELGPERTGTTAAALSAPPSPTINTFVVYAANNVTLGTGDHSLGGDIGVATSNGSSPQLTVGGQDQLDINHTLFAPSISIGNLAQVGAVDTNSLTNNGGQVGTQRAYPASMPSLPAIFAATPGTANVTVAQGHQQTLSPGSFGALTDNGIVLLNPGAYSFASVTLGNNAQLLAQQGGSTSVLVAGAFAAGTQAQILPVGQPANELTISVSGSDGTNGSPPAVSIGANSQIVSLLAAPNGTVSLGNNAQATGAYAGLNCTAGSNVVLNFQSGFANSTPSFSTFVAYAELSMTLGVGDHTIGGDIGVAALGASSVGTQLTIGSQDVLDPIDTVYSPSVSIGSQAAIGDVDTNTLTNSGGSFGAQAPYPASAMPLLPLALASTPNTTNVTVPQGHQQTLSPGSFGALTDNGIVFLNPGTYSFASVTLGNNAQLQALQGGSTTVLVAGNLSTGTFAQIFPAGQPAGNLTISVAGNDGAGGAPPAASIGANTQLIALLNVPHGTLSLGGSVQATGAFAGFSLTAGTNVTLTFQSGFLSTAPGQRGQQQLSGYITPAMAAAPLVASIPGTTQVQLAIGLPLRNPQLLQDTIMNLYTPTSPQYHKYLSPSDFAANFGPLPGVTQPLQTFLNANALLVTQTYTSNQLIDVTGSAEAIETTFFMNLNQYQRSDGALFYGPDREPSLQLSGSTATILRIDGFDNFNRPQPLGGSGPIPTTATEGLGFMSTGVPLYMDLDFRHAYVPGTTLTGTGQTIALVEMDGFLLSDIASYATATSAALPTHVMQTVQPVVLPGSVNFTGAPLTEAGQSEAELDIDMALSMAPGVDAVFVYMEATPTFGSGTPPLSYQQAVDDVFAAIANPGVMGNPLSYQIGCSWVQFEGANTAALVEQFAVQGQSFFISSGDGGEVYASNPPPIPLSDSLGEVSLMTVVGGTQLTTGSGAMPWISETTWNDNLKQRGLAGVDPFKSTTSGGVIQGVPIPWYQSAIPESQILAANGDPTQRNIPDVALIATDIGVYTAYVEPPAIGSTPPPGIYFAAGTSAAAPLWAGMAALVNQQATSVDGLGPLGFANPAIYNIGQGARYQSDFHDINDMSTNMLNDTSPSAPSYPAIPGYDLCTGWGTPAGQNLIYDLAGSAPPVLTQVSVGYNSACAINAGGVVYCWGFNPSGQLGNGGPVTETTSADSSTPVRVQGQTISATAVSVSQQGDFACGIFGGEVDCWGDDLIGQLGNDPQFLSSPGSTVPVPVPGLGGGVTAVSAGGTFACAVTAGQHVMCWGAYNDAFPPFPEDVDQLGNGSSVSGPYDQDAAVPNIAGPVEVTGPSGPLSGVAAVSAGNDYACALLATGTVACWGYNGDGELGDGMTTDSLAPVRVTGLSGVTSLSAGYSSACVTTSDGAVWCWGFGFGSTPSEIISGGSSGTVASAVSVGAGVACAIVGSGPAGGAVECWGDAVDVSSPTPMTITGLSRGVTAVSIGTDSACAIMASGVASCWGDDSYGELGDGAPLVDGICLGCGSSVPVPVVGFP